MIYDNDHFFCKLNVSTRKYKEMATEQPLPPNWSTAILRRRFILQCFAELDIIESAENGNKKYRSKPILCRLIQLWEIKNNSYRYYQYCTWYIVCKLAGKYIIISLPLTPLYRFSTNGFKLVAVSIYDFNLNEG